VISFFQWVLSSLQSVCSISMQISVTHILNVILCCFQFVGNFTANVMRPFPCKILNAWPYRCGDHRYQEHHLRCIMYNGSGMRIEHMVLASSTVSDFDRKWISWEITSVKPTNHKVCPLFAHSQTKRIPIGSLLPVIPPYQTSIVCFCKWVKSSLDSLHVHEEEPTTKPTGKPTSNCPQ